MADPVNILIVDDMPAQRLSIEAALSDLGENIVSVGSGREALKFLLENDAAVVLLDVNMPEIDGFETATLIRQRQRSASTPVIFLTADTDELQAARGYALGAVDYLFCPFLPDILRTKVKVFVDLSRAQERIRRDADQRIALLREQAARAAAESQSRRLRFLAETSGALTKSLDGKPFVGEMLGLFVPRWADLAALTLREPQQGPASSTWVSTHEREPRTDDVPDEGLADALARCLVLGERVLTSNANGVSRVAIPLIAGGATYGALGVAMMESSRVYVDDDIELLHLVAGRATVALDNRNLYAELQDRDRRKDEFLAMLSHELRNPLGAITTAVRLLEHLDTNDSRATRARDVIGRQSIHLTRIVDDLLEVSRVTSGRIELLRAQVDLKRLAERVLESLHVSGRVSDHKVAIDGGGVFAEADEARMEQVMTNLLVNALKYTDAGGEVVIELTNEGEEAVIRVRDSGIGISAELLPHVFDVFVQGHQALDRAEGGLGLGLALVRKLVELQRGNVSAASEGAGKGTTFTVRLPRVTGDTAVPEAAATAPAIPSMRVLLVEDHDDMREMMRSVLVMRGQEVLEASNGPEALELARATKPHLALVDLGLPGFDGFEVARLLKADATTQGIMLVAVTGYGQAQDRRRSLEIGFEEHLVKPVGSEQLGRLLEIAARRLTETVES